jgi:sugar transferase (PEP-CTERM/EpsH1 system associated)
MRVLYLTHRLPYAPNRGDRVRAFHTLKALAGRAKVELLSLVHDRAEASQVGVLRDLATVTVALVPKWRNRVRAAAALPTTRPLTEVLLDAPALAASVRDIVERGRPDVVLAYCSSMARVACLPLLRDIPLVLDLVDVDSQKWQDLAGRSSGPMRWIYRREARCLGAFEASVATSARATLVVNEREAAVARRLAPQANVQVVENGIDIPFFRAPADQRRTARVVFCGVMNYQPNEEGAVWLARNVWPLVTRRRPGTMLSLVGSNPTGRIRAACASDSSIEITGTVEDVRPFLWRATVAVAPLWVARGIQNKVLEAIAAGLPSVVTPAVADGLPAAALPACCVADTAERFADAIVEFLDRSETERQALTAPARLAGLDWHSTLAPLLDLVEAAATRGRRSTRTRPVKLHYRASSF